MNNKLINLFITNSTVSHPLQLENTTNTKAKALPDTSTMTHYLDKHARQHCSNIQPTSNDPTVQVVNGNKIVLDLNSTLKISHKISYNVQCAHIFDYLHTGSLIYIGKLCDDDCILILTKYNFKIVKNNEVIITGKYDDKNGLWNIPLDPYRADPQSSSPPTHQKIVCKLNGVLRFYKKTGTIFAYVHILPHQTNLYQINQPQVFPFMARPICGTHKKTSPDITLYGQRPS